MFCIYWDRVNNCDINHRFTCFVSDLCDLWDKTKSQTAFDSTKVKLFWENLWQMITLYLHLTIARSMTRPLWNIHYTMTPSFTEKNYNSDSFWFSLSMTIMTWPRPSFSRRRPRRGGQGQGSRQGPLRALLLGGPLSLTFCKDPLKNLGQ